MSADGGNAPRVKGVRPSSPAVVALNESELQDTAVSLQGHYSGPVTRLLAFALDQGVVNGLFALTLALLDTGYQAIEGSDSGLRVPGVVATIAYGVWWLVYFAYPWAVSGRTLGMAFVGIRVVATDGSELPPGRSFVRAVALALGFATLGIGLLWALIDRRRRALHDVLAGSAVVYDWDARAARLRFLARSSSAPELGHSTLGES